jgi:DNA-binding response OmpR family regulator
MRLLVAEDDALLRDVLVRGLRELSYAVDATGDGAEAVTMAVVYEFDALVLDVLLPGKDGLTICRELRARGVMVPILLLTSRDAVDDRIGGLDAGADDYLTKPFAFGELSARLRALLRRPVGVLPTIIGVGDLEIDLTRLEARRGGEIVPLTAREFTFLAYLARQAGRVVSRAELSDHVWDGNHDPAANVIDVYVSRIRRKLESGGRSPLLHIRRGAGILLAADPTGSDAG